MSHASANRAFASRVADVLRVHRVAVWYSSANIVGAQQWHDEIGAALDRCDCFVVILSHAAVASPWVKRELIYALNDDRYGERIVPIVHSRCDWARLSWTLDAIQMIDFRRSFEDGCRALLRVWGLAYRQVPSSGRTKRP